MLQLKKQIQRKYSRYKYTTFNNNKKCGTIITKHTNYINKCE